MPNTMVSSSQEFTEQRIGIMAAPFAIIWGFIYQTREDALKRLAFLESLSMALWVEDNTREYNILSIAIEETEE